MIDRGGSPDRSTKSTYTNADFERLSWHDCHIWGFGFRIGDPEENDWTSDFVLDLDFIVESMCGIAGASQFRVAPATLVFHQVSDQRIEIDWGDSGFQVALHGTSIEWVEREAVANPMGRLETPYYRWRIRLNWPEGGEIAFGAVGFTQSLLAEPVLTDKQHLSYGLRSRLIRE